MASWREQIPVLDSHGGTGKFAQAAKTFNYSNTKNTKLENHDRKEPSAIGRLVAMPKAAGPDFGPRCDKGQQLYQQAEGMMFVYKEEKKKKVSV